MVYYHKISDPDQLKQVLIDSWAQLSSTHWTERLISGQKDWRWLSRQRVIMLNFVWTLD